MRTQRQFFNPQAGPFATLEGVPERTRSILHTAWRAGLNPVEEAPEGDRRIFALSGLDERDVFGAISIDRRNGRVLRAVLIRGDSGVAKPETITDAPALQRMLTELAVEHMKTGPQKVLTVLRSDGPEALRRHRAGEPVEDHARNLQILAGAFGLELEQVGFAPEPQSPSNLGVPFG